MNRRKIITIGLILGFVILFLIAIVKPADAAVCRHTPVRFVGNWNYDDDETATYAKVYDQVRKNCDGTYTRRVGLYPNRDKNRRLSCASTRAFVFNPTSVYGKNPTTFRAGCDSDGFQRSWRWRPTGTDRGFNMSGHADKRAGWLPLPDPHFRTPTRYAWRR